MLGFHPKERTIWSNVPGFLGICVPIWLNTNQVYNRLAGGSTGFFKLVKPSIFGTYKTFGKEFHGIIYSKWKHGIEIIEVHTTETPDEEDA